jgi:hypothetical protein
VVSFEPREAKVKGREFEPRLPGCSVATHSGSNPHHDAMGLDAPDVVPVDAVRASSAGDAGTTEESPWFR